MKLSLMTVTLLIAAALHAQSQPKIDDLKWLAGSWTVAENGTTTEEYWSQPDAGTMIGMGRTIAGGKTVFFEYLRIEQRPEGLVYVAHPKARSGTDFKLKSLSNDEVVFENPAHDFPKRIVYHRNADSTITAHIEGDPADKEKAESFHYQRIGS